MTEHFPHYTANQQLEKKSFDELANLVSGFFILRDQRNPDFGVDLTLEVVLDNCATNFVTAVQLKARASVSANPDGSRSLSLESKNVEYLLSAARSLVVLYVADEAAFFVAKVVDEVQRLRASGVDYRTQDSVTFRLRDRFARNTIEAIHQRAIAEGRGARDLATRIAALVSEELVHVETGGGSRSSSEIEVDLLKQGWRLAVQARLDEVVRLFGLLTSTAQRRSRIRLLMAHAYACSGQPVAAWQHAIEARETAAELDANDRDLLEVVEIGIEFALQRVSNAEVSRREREIRDRSAPSMRVQLDVSLLRREVTAVADPSRFREFAERARILLAEAARTLGDGHPAVLASMVFALDLTAHALISESRQVLMSTRHGDDIYGLRMRSGRMLADASAEVRASLNAWRAELAETRLRTAAWPLLDMELEKADLMVQTILLRDASTDACAAGADWRIDLTSGETSSLYDRVVALRDRARLLRVDDIESRACVLQLCLLELAERTADVQSEAHALEAIARRRGDGIVATEAVAYAEGRSEFQLVRAEFAAAATRSPNNMTPVERDRAAQNIVEALRLPSERFGNVRCYVDAQAAAVELFEWCRHFELLTEDDENVPDLALFVRRPARACRCGVRNESTRFPSDDLDIVVRGFRQTYCEGCALRSPGVS